MVEGKKNESARLTPQERAVLDVLIHTSDRVIDRRELARRVGITDMNERRCDSLLVGIRRVLGPDTIRTVRGRGWILEAHALQASRSIMSMSDRDG